ncbi:DUF58 domain-containing protein [Brevibacterium litoralis]|uniref:DUF58 domain-containing protein n=1 Tax=Brevibacterium litoralis TaxID=3138935 RepID=UPI0032F04C86
MRLNSPGVVFLLVGATLCVAAYRFSLPGLLPAGIMLGVLVVVSLLVAALSSARLEVRIDAALPTPGGTPAGRVGEEIHLRARIRNRVPVPLGPFTVRFDPVPGSGEVKTADIPGMPVGGRLTVEAALLPVRRGPGGLRALVARVDGPFGLCAVTKRVHGDYPVTVGAAHLDLPRPASAGAGGRETSRHRDTLGRTERDLLTREYVPGDDLRHVHWKSTARTGDLRVRPEIAEDTPHLVVVLDVHGDLSPRPEGPDGGTGTSGARAADASPPPQDPLTELAVLAATAAAEAHLAAGFSVQWVAGDTDTELVGRRGAERLRLLSAAPHLVPDATDTALPALGHGADLLLVTRDRDRATVLEGMLRRPRAGRPAHVRTLVAAEAPAGSPADRDLSADLFSTGVAVPADWTPSLVPSTASRRTTR